MPSRRIPRALFPGAAVDPADPAGGSVTPTGGSTPGWVTEPVTQSAGAPSFDGTAVEPDQPRPPPVISAGPSPPDRQERLHDMPVMALKERHVIAEPGGRDRLTTVIDGDQVTGDMPVPPASERGIMIDSPSTRDRDDAIWVRHDTDHVDMWVHIADVSGHLAQGSSADATARDRVHTRYLPDRAIGMLPPAVEAAATLRPDIPQSTMAVQVRFDTALEPTTVAVARGRLSDAHQLSYPEVTKILDNGGHPLRPVLAQAQDLANGLLARRRRNGALAFYDLYKGYASTEEGNLIRLADHQRHIGYLIVQEFMIAANAAVARWCAANDLPILYRNHRTATVAGDTSGILDELASAQAKGDTAGYELLRDRLGVVQRPAEYEPVVQGHHGLNLPVYTHATSPLRRFPDLVNQRILLAADEGRPSPYSPTELVDLAGEVNQRLQQERQRRAERHRATAKRLTRKQLDASRYHDLDETEFGRVLRMAASVAAAPPTALITETRRRVSAETLTMRDRYELLLRTEQAEWRDIRERLYRDIATEPAHALTIINMYAQTESGGPVTTEQLNWDIKPIGTAQQPRFQARLSFRLSDRTVTSAARSAASKKDAKAQAGLSMLGQLADLTDLSADLAPPAPATPPPASRVPDDRHPAMAVNEYTQTNVITAATWQFDRQGPPHEPRFTCTVDTTFVPDGHRLQATATAGSKQLAKVAAAADLRSLIEAKLDTVEPL